MTFIENYRKAKKRYLHHICSGKDLKGIVIVNWGIPPFNDRSLEIISTAPS